MKKAIICILSLLVLSGCGTVSEKTVDGTDTPAPKSTKAMTLEEKVGQMLMVRCDSITQEDITKIQPGGIIMFQSDFAELNKSEVKKKQKALMNLLIFRHILQLMRKVEQLYV